MQSFEYRHTGMTTEIPGFIVAGGQHTAATGTGNPHGLAYQIRTFTQFHGCVETILVHVDDLPHRLIMKLMRLGRVASGKPKLRIAQCDFPHGFSGFQQDVGLAHLLEGENFGM